MDTKEKIKQYLDANVHDGEDRKGCHCDKAVFTPDELQELVEEACEYALKEKKGQAKSYKALGAIKGWRADSWRGTLHEDDSSNCGSNSILWATKEQAEASKAMAQLSQLMQAANGGWEPDWEDSNLKWVLHTWANKVNKDSFTYSKHFLVFKSFEVRDEFFELHRDLIMQARPLL